MSAEKRKERRERIEAIVYQPPNMPPWQTRAMLLARIQELEAIVEAYKQIIIQQTPNQERPDEA